MSGMFQTAEAYRHSWQCSTPLYSAEFGKTNHPSLALPVYRQTSALQAIVQIVVGLIVPSLTIHS